LDLLEEGDLVLLLVYLVIQMFIILDLPAVAYGKPMTKEQIGLISLMDILEVPLE
jgi:hypothetical protein